MGSRRYVVVGAVAAAALLAGMANANAEPTSDTSDRRAVEVQAPSSAKRAAVDPIASQYVPVTPVRVLDTRANGGAPVGQGGVVTVDLNGRTPSNATAVILNVTGTDGTASTFVTVYPANEARPSASNLNLTPRQTRANQVTVGISSADRRIALYNNAGSTHLIADLAGYYIDGAASRYNAVQPGRVLDTRGGSPVGPFGSRDIVFSWLPDTATSVTFNLTGVNATTNTFVTAYPAGGAIPVASNVNLGPGEVVPNQVTVPLGTNKTVRLLNGNGNVHLIADMVGYYATDSGSWFIPISPERALDTRVSPPGLTPDIFIALTGWPDGFTGVAANLTGTNPSTSQYVVVYPGGAAIPGTSNLNLFGGQTAANAVNAGIGFEPEVGDYAINFANNAGYVDVIFDIAGFFVV
jgi:hypothetical protein